MFVVKILQKPFRSRRAIVCAALASGVLRLKRGSGCVGVSQISFLCAVTFRCFTCNIIIRALGCVVRHLNCLVLVIIGVDFVLRVEESPL